MDFKVCRSVGRYQQKLEQAPTKEKELEHRRGVDPVHGMRRYGTVGVLSATVENGGKRCALAYVRREKEKGRPSRCSLQSPCGWRTRAMCEWTRLSCRRLGQSIHVVDHLFHSVHCTCMFVSSCGMTTTYYTYVCWTECDGVVIRVIRPA